MNLFPGLPEYDVPPIDPLKSEFIELSREGDGKIAPNFHVAISNLTIRGFTQSSVTSVKVNWDKNQLIFKQYFPKLISDGEYIALVRIGKKWFHFSGMFNLTLIDFNQTTFCTNQSKVDGLKVNIEVDKPGNIEVNLKPFFFNYKI